MAIDIASQSMFDLYAEVPLPDTYGGHDILNGDSLSMLDLYPENTFHSVVTDPPYGFGKVHDIASLVYAWLTDADPTKYVTKGGFMGQAWDKSVPQPALWKKVYRVLRPGGYCAAFCGARTQDLMGLSLRLAGFDIRDCIYWVYGCLSADTEIYIDGKWVAYTDLHVGQKALTFNLKTQKFEEQGIQEVLVYPYNDTAYRIQSKDTDQIVSRNHRCLIKQGKEYVYRYAEEIVGLQTVPIIKPMPAVRSGGVSFVRSRNSLPSLCKRTGGNGGRRMSRLQKGFLSLHRASSAGESAYVRLQMQRRVTGSGVGKAWLQRQSRMVGGNQGSLCAVADRFEESRLEGRRNLYQEKRQLRAALRSLSRRVQRNESLDRLCAGTSLSGGADFGQAADSQRNSTPQRSQSPQQRSAQSYAVQEQRGSQEIREAWAATPDLARVTPFQYEGNVWCVRVPNGTFVARRNGKIFVTGNSGYPKVHDISKAIDAKLGAVRSKKRYEPRAETSGTMSGKAETRPWIEKSREDGYYETDDDQPVSDEAKQWDGWKNLLKPGIEIIILAQKPLEKNLTISENVLKWGTGGLNIGAVSLPRKAKKWSEPKGGIWSGSVDNGAVLQENADGGYPPNVIYSHTIFCVKSGTKKIRGTGKRIEKPARQGTPHMQERPWMQDRRDAGLPLKEDWSGFTDADGNEEVDAWDCHPNCPILALDTQSGYSKSSSAVRHNRPGPNRAMSGPNTGSVTGGHADEGGASRYFTQFGWTDMELSEWDSCFQYIPKPVKSEKNRGLKGLPKGKKVFNGTSDKSTESPKGVEIKFSTEPQENTHTTVKPVAVFQWLIRLLTMPGGKVLDPFMGSGTSAIPAIALGFQYTGIELDETYFKICQGRVACALRDKSRILT